MFAAGSPISATSGLAVGVHLMRMRGENRRCAPLGRRRVRRACGQGHPPRSGRSRHLHRLLLHCRRAAVLPRPQRASGAGNRAAPFAAGARDRLRCGVAAGWQRGACRDDRRQPAAALAPCPPRTCAPGCCRAAGGAQHASREQRRKPRTGRVQQRRQRRRRRRQLLERRSKKTVQPWQPPPCVTWLWGREFSACPTRSACWAGPLGCSSQVSAARMPLRARWA